VVGKTEDVIKNFSNKIESLTEDEQEQLTSSIVDFYNDLYADEIDEEDSSGLEKELEKELDEEDDSDLDDEDEDEDKDGKEEDETNLEKEDKTKGHKKEEDDSDLDDDDYYLDEDDSDLDEEDEDKEDETNLEEENEVPVVKEEPKKRGRKPKGFSVVEEEPKKRGRKPREASIVPKEPKKRGRKFNTKAYQDNDAPIKECKRPRKPLLDGVMSKLVFPKEVLKDVDKFILNNKLPKTKLTDNIILKVLMNESVSLSAKDIYTEAQKYSGFNLSYERCKSEIGKLRCVWSLLALYNEDKGLTKKIGQALALMFAGEKITDKNLVIDRSTITVIQRALRAIYDVAVKKG
jgi:hypothetical protein